MLTFTRIKYKNGKHCYKAVTEAFSVHISLTGYASRLHRYRMVIYKRGKRRRMPVQAKPSTTHRTLKEAKAHAIDVLKEITP